MSGVFGILDGMRRSSGILIVLVFNILSKLILNTNIVKIFYCAIVKSEVDVFELSNALSYCNGQ